MKIESHNTQLCALVKKAKRKDKAAMQSIVKMLHSQIYALILLRVGNREDALDISQDVFIKAWKNIRHLETPSKFKSWLFTIAYNRIKDFYRKRRILTFWGLTKDYENLSFESSNREQSCPKSKFSELKEKLESLLTLMSKNEKEVFLMKFIDELTIGEIASSLNKSQSTVKTYLYRSIEKFRKTEKKLNIFLDN